VDGYLDYLHNPPDLSSSLDQLDLAGLKRLRQRLFTRLLVLATTTPTDALSPGEWWQLY
jgi:hypothetical protein